MMVEHVVQHVDKFMHGWLGVPMVHKSQLGPQPMVDDSDECWKKPLTDKAAVVHNNTGEFIRCISIFMKSTLDSFIVEILVAR
ncbi:hypothetical protein Goshw_023465 [Gossypium schwendimanii]|uniref:Uncharacterized protein n=1 Tax=Gossypium schwendimanii TaxID=34291 RepID=A0A7J9LZH4_GOSSC|nr:hypothetical protein [Gossypium schwendimanii]